jgi:hypothetical protein
MVVMSLISLFFGLFSRGAAGPAIVPPIISCITPALPDNTGAPIFSNPQYLVQRRSMLD